MGKFEPLIEWLRKQMAQAVEARADLCNGQGIEINDNDVTAEWIARYEDIISQCKVLIAAYAKRDH